MYSKFCYLISMPGTRAARECILCILSVSYEKINMSALMERHVGMGRRDLVSGDLGFTLLSGDDWCDLRGARQMSTLPPVSLGCETT